VIVAVFVLATLVGWMIATVVDPKPAPTNPPPAVPLSVASTAELFTSLYLSGTSGEAIARIFAGDPPPQSGVWVNHSAAVAAHQVDADRWEVTVAVDSLESRNGQFAPVSLGFYLVPMAISEGRAVALAAPARVPAPTIPTLAHTAMSAVTDDQAAAARQFIELHLEGDPATARYLKSPSAVTGFPTPPYASVLTEVVGADTLGRVRVSALATTANGVNHNLEYLVTLEADESGWRVAAVGSAVP
jgi:hypothetical protein